MHEIMKVYLPVKFGIGRLGKITPGLLPAASILEKLFINIERLLQVNMRLILINVHHTLRSLVIDLGLSSKFRRFVILLGND
jgi:hypothetical protein